MREMVKMTKVKVVMETAMIEKAVKELYDMTNNHPLFFLYALCSEKSTRVQNPIQDNNYID